LLIGGPPGSGIRPQSGKTFFELNVTDPIFLLVASLDEFVDEKSLDLNNPSRSEDWIVLEKKIGARGFEPPTSWSRTRRKQVIET
jgi:hypothetical protein